MLRALVEGELNQQWLRGLLDRLTGLGLSTEDRRQVMMMLSFLLSIRRGGDSSRYQDIVNEVLAMLQLEDSFIYQAGLERATERGVEKLRQRALDISRERFGRDHQAEQRIRAIDDLEQLADLISYLRTATNLPETFAAAGMRYA